MAKSRVTAEMTKKVQELWHEGFPIKYLCNVSGLSRNTIRRLVAGIPRLERKKAPETDPILNIAVEKCPACGRVGPMPCVRCIAAWRNSSRRLQPSDFEGVDIEAVLRECSTYKSKPQTSTKSRKKQPGLGGVAN